MLGPASKFRTPAPAPLLYHLLTCSHRPRVSLGALRPLGASTDSLHLAFPRQTHAARAAARRPRLAAEVSEPSRGIRLQVLTTAPGLQVGRGPRRAPGHAGRAARPSSCGRAS
jgi:galactose mutarotase-like enzyme